MKLQKKYFLIFFSIFVVLSLAMSVTTYFFSNNILLNKYEDMSADSLSYLLEITDKELEQLSSTFVFIANEPTVHERIVTNYADDEQYQKLTDNASVDGMLDAMSTFDIFGAIEVLYIRGMNGEEYWSTSIADFIGGDEVLTGVDFDQYDSRRLIYHGVIENRNPYQESDNVLRFTKSLIDSAGQQAGVAYFELDADYFKNLYDNSRLEMDTRIYLVDAQDIIIYHEDPYMIGRSLESMEITGVVVEETLSRYGWRLISESPTAQIYDESGMIFNVTTIMAVISIVAALVIIMFTTGKIVQPIQRLTKAMEDVRDGDLDAQVYHISNDEIGELTDNFNRMTNRLKDNIENEIAYNKSLNDAEYKALQAQINPHFMYNSLNALKWLAGIQGAENISDMVDALWTLLRKTSSMKGQNITLEQELEVIMAYCTIQQVRYKGKFEVVYNIEEDHGSLHIPKYILQPFVENAIFHGIEPKKGPGTITISSESNDKDLILKVVDDGVGMSVDKMNRILVSTEEQQHGAGLNNIGVKNIHERLHLLFGEDYGIMVNSSIGEGTTMSIRIPLIYGQYIKQEGDQNV